MRESFKKKKMNEMKCSPASAFVFFMTR